MRFLPLALLGLISAACTDAHRVTSPTARPVRLQVGASASLAADATVLVRVSYARRDGGRVELGRQSATLTPGGAGGAGSQSLAMVVDIAPCLEDPERAGSDGGANGSASCPAQVQLQLLRGETVLDEVQRTVLLVPGENATLGGEVALHEVASLSVQVSESPAIPGTPPSFEVGQRLTATATVLDRTGAPIPDRVVAWSTSTPNTIRLGATTGASITIDPIAPGSGDVSASTGGRQLRTELRIAPESPRQVLLGPVDSTVFVGDTVGYAAQARGATGTPITGAAFQYEALPASVATVSAQGIAVARAPGVAIITATTAGLAGAPVQGQATLRVLARPGLLVDAAAVVLSTQAGQPLPSRAVAVTSIGAPLGGLTASVLGDVPVTATFNPLSTPSTLTIAATRSLAIGDTLRGTVRVRSTTPGVLPVDIPVTVVGLGPPPVILTPAAIDFGTVDSGTVVPPAGVAVTTTAGRTVGGLAASVSYDAGPSAGWLSATLDRSGTAATLSVQPRMEGLASGTYAATITVTGTGATQAQVSVRLVVRGRVELQATPATVDFGSLDSGSVSTASDVAISTRDGRTATGLSASTAYDGTTSVQWLTASLTGTSTGSALRLTARTLGLRPGSYRATVTVGASTPATTRPVQVPVTVTVRGPDSLVVTPSVIDFGTLQPGETPPERGFTVTTVQGRAVALAPELLAQFTPATPTTWLNRAFTSSLVTPATGTVAVATQGLQPGTYSANITVRSTATGVRPTSFRVTLTIAGPVWSQVAAGSGHSCARTTAGEVYCWGRNQYGQLGNNSAVPSETPVRVASALRFTEVSVGGFHSCARTTEGEVHCWGANFEGQLGTSSNLTESRVPVRVTSTVSFTTVSAGRYHSCARTPVGDLYCWGYNGSGQLGSGSDEISLPTPVRVSSTQSFTSVSAGDVHSCGRTGAGAIYCWGSNGGGQLGNDSTSGSSTPVRVSSTLSFAGVSVGASHSCGRTSNGELHCWGDNFYGQLGNNSTGTRFGTPVRVASTLTFTSVAAGSWHTCARTSSGQVYCWGDNFYGQLGDGSTVELSRVPVRVTSELSFIDVSAGGNYSCSWTAAGMLHCWGSNTDDEEQSSVLGAAGRAAADGREARRPRASGARSSRDRGGRSR